MVREIRLTGKECETHWDRAVCLRLLGCGHILVARDYLIELRVSNQGEPSCRQGVEKVRHRRSRIAQRPNVERRDGCEGYSLFAKIHQDGERIAHSAVWTPSLIAALLNTTRGVSHGICNPG